MANQPFDFQLTAPVIRNLIPNATNVQRMAPIGRKSLTMIKRRVQEKHTDAEDRRLAPYKVRTSKGHEWVDKHTTRKGNVPPEIFQQVRKVKGAIARPKSAVKGKPSRATPLYYRGGPEKVEEYTKKDGTKVKAHTRKSKSVVKGKSKRSLWGYMWTSEADFVADEYSSRRVDFTRTGSMWDATEIKFRKSKPGNVHMVLRFKGTNPRGGINTLWKKYKDKKRVPASIRAYFLNSRDAKGNTVGPKAGKPRPWFHFTKSEAKRVGEEWNKLIAKSWQELPTLKMSTRDGNTRATISGGK